MKMVAVHGGGGYIIVEYYHSYSILSCSMKYSLGEQVPQHHRCHSWGLIGSVNHWCKD